jgi:uncharacterized protein YqiB (DUF1249 family)
MSLYESNFVRLRWLLPDDRRLSGSLVSRVPSDLPLYLDVFERSRYTTTIRLTYFFEEDGVPVPDPDLTIRLYLDAHLAEAMACTRHHRHKALKPFDTRPGVELSRRWARNVMLNKWLEYCADRNHEFRRCESADARVLVP